MSSDACRDGVLDMVTSVLDVVETAGELVLTGGLATAARKGATGLTKAAIKAATKTAVKKLKSGVKGVTKETVKQYVDQAVNEHAKDFKDEKSKDNYKKALAAQLLKMIEDDKEEDNESFDPTSLDPTGIASTVKAFKHETCPLDPVPPELPQTKIPGQPAGVGPVEETDHVARKLHDELEDLAGLYTNLAVMFAKAGQKHFDLKNSLDPRWKYDPAIGITDPAVHRYWARFGANRGQIPQKLANRLSNFQGMSYGTYEKRDDFVQICVDMSVEIAKLGKLHLKWNEGEDTTATYFDPVANNRAPDPFRGSTDTAVQQRWWGYRKDGDANMADYRAFLIKNRLLLLEPVLR